MKIQNSQKTLEVLHGGWTEFLVGSSTFEGNNAKAEFEGVEKANKRINNSVKI